MVPIKLALLWHQHQPDYRTEEEIVLPWVRLHTTKDYLEMVQHLERYPTMHATINLVPSLIRQIEAYRDGVEDEILFVSKKEIALLTEDEKIFLIHNCFNANRERIIARSPRYNELWEKQHNNESFSESDLRDLAVHFALAWTGEFSRFKSPFDTLIQKDRDFTEDEKTLLFTSLHKIFAEIIPYHKKLMDSGQIEISTTPFYHPILPLLCDTNSATEAMPHVTLPEKRFSFVRDAYEQVQRAKVLYQERFDSKLKGMWPAEGSISNEALKVLVEENISWAASDESVLLHSLMHENSKNDDTKYGELEKYFPRKFNVGEKSITLFFRDHWLSDRIGFDYATWNAYDAAMDFIHKCKEIRSLIVDSFGEEALRESCISVILDGENCWENYYENGKYFLDEFYKALTTTEEIQSITFSNALEEIGQTNVRAISHIVAGSWINANFKIWIGHPEKNRAWDLLADAAEAFHSYKAIGDEAVKHYQSAYIALLQAEGSDWFWWYGDDNSSSQKHLFDSLFRSHLVEMYIHLRLPVPHVLFENIGGGDSSGGQYGAMHRAD